MAARKIIEPGTRFISKAGVEVEVVLYTTCTDVLVRRVADGVEFKCTSANLRAGLVSGIQGARGRAKVTLELPDDAAWVVGMEGSYAVTRCGKVLSFKSGLKIRELKGGRLYRHGNKEDKTYKVVCLTDNGVNKTYYVHRLIAETFIPNPEAFPTVNHINGDKIDNSVVNLEWCTESENTTHAYNSGLMDNTSRSSRYSRGYYDDRIKSAIEFGSAEYGVRGVIATLTDEELFSRGFDPIKARSLESDPRKTEFSNEKIIEMHSTGVTMTKIAKITGFSLSAISRKINGSRN